MNYAYLLLLTFNWTYREPRHLVWVFLCPEVGGAVRTFELIPCPCPRAWVPGSNLPLLQGKSTPLPGPWGLTAEARAQLCS